MRCLLVLGALISTPAAAFELQLPVACELGKTCFIQQYVDHDPGPGVQDYRCGTLANDQHNGTDFRLPSLKDMRSGVAVLAAAPGRVLRVRNNVTDRKFRREDPSSVAGTECGNGVVLAHADGYETQYCHLAQGSITLRVGDEVEAGQRIGTVGLSGMTEFPHLHFSLRRAGEVVDPFAADSGSCGSGTSLWASRASGLSYQAGQVLNAGFTTSSVTMDQIEEGAPDAQGMDAQAPAMVAYVRTIGLRQGDVQRLTVSGPSGKELVSNQRNLESNQAQTLLFAGRKRVTSVWERGVYTAVYTVSREGRDVITKRFSIELQ